jgi:hypothetical protein
MDVSIANRTWLRTTCSMGSREPMSSSNGKCRLRLPAVWATEDRSITTDSLDRQLAEAYPHLIDDPFVIEHRGHWLSDSYLTRSEM